MTDVEMTTESSPTEPVPSIETKEELAEADKPSETVEEKKQTTADAEASDNDNDNDNDVTGENEDEGIEVTDLTDEKVSNDLYKSFKATTEVLLNFKIKTRGNEEHFPSGIFKRLPNKRLFPDYYEVVKEPSAISTLRGKIQRKQYNGVQEFVRDFALIVYNAQVYNRPNSQPVRDVLKLDELFKAELQKLVDNGMATEEDIKYPELGEIPHSTPEPDPVTEDEDDDGDGDEDEEDEEIEGEESDDDKRRKRSRRGTKTSATGKKGEEEDEEDKGGDAEQKRRGRPPKVATPMEHRIDRILKSLKKPKSKNGVSMISPFERLPDKAEMPEYYQVITQPMAYDILKKKAKRKKYASVDEFMGDVELMFKNAMHFNEDGSDIHTWAIELLEEAKKAEAEERAKPDSEYLTAADGRMPLPHIIYKGDMWKVGDWIHVQNPNDITKPIVAQIYRTWKTVNDEEWINACWYYRPEQTVHQYEKHFYPNEVGKTGQYRDHKIEEVLNKCFVMFYTRYSRGRPRNLPADTEVYVCEARYNEEKSKFNKIKTWASCLPDEVRDKDYEMDLFDAPRKIKKIQSPLLSRLKDDAKETDELPQPEWKHANAPPLVGGIHKRPRDENQSPPPEPTPPPPPAPTPIARNPSINQSDDTARNTVWVADRQSIPRSQIQSQPQPVRPTPSLTPQPSFTGNVGQYNRPPSYTGTAQPYQSSTPNIPQPPVAPYQYNHQTQPTPIAAAHPGTYASASTPMNYVRPAPTAVQPMQYHPQQMNGATSRSAEAYVLSDPANASIPKEVRDQFPTDDKGRLLFFTQPPLNTQHVVSGSSQGEKDQPLQHSDKYMKTLAVRKRKLEQHHADSTDVAVDNEQTQSKQLKVGEGNGIRSPADRAGLSQAQLRDRATGLLTEQMKQATYKEYEARYGDDWRKLLLADLDYQVLCHKKELKRKESAAEQRSKFDGQRLSDQPNGQSAVNSQGYITGWQKNFFTGSYLDDYDSRLP